MGMSNRQDHVAENSHHQMEAQSRAQSTSSGGFTFPSPAPSDRLPPARAHSQSLPKHHHRTLGPTGDIYYLNCHRDKSNIHG